MYEAWFGLSRRPFSATPDPSCFFSTEATRGAVDELSFCLESGQGVALLLGPAGSGKTLICSQVAQELRRQFSVVALTHSGFGSRRALLQTLLSELGQPYASLGEQELRLRLLPAIRERAQSTRGLVLIVDEAEHLSEGLLEELRMLADLAEGGTPLVRLLLSGQPRLEETLAHPQLQPLNQRLRSHVCLPTFTHEESREYIDYRLTWAGGRLTEVFDEAAVEAIVDACDGLPRCLNQLGDHVLLLSYVAEQKPVARLAVEEALDDLRHLPLPWRSPRSHADSDLFSRTRVTSDQSGMSAVEIGFDGPPAMESSSELDTMEEFPAVDEELPQTAGLDVDQLRSINPESFVELTSVPQISRFEPNVTSVNNLEESTEESDLEEEEVVYDPYARPESFRGLEPIAGPESASTDDHNSLSDEFDAFEFTPPDTQISRLIPLVASASSPQVPVSGTGPTETAHPAASLPRVAEKEALEDEIHRTVVELGSETTEFTKPAIKEGAVKRPIETFDDSEIEAGTRSIPTDFNDDANSDEGVQWLEESDTASAPSEERPYRNLFSRLRLKQLADRSRRS